MTVAAPSPARGRNLLFPSRNAQLAARRLAELSTIERLADPMPTDRLWGWIVTLTITLVSFLIRFVNLANPRYLVFDETYYPKDAWTLSHHGYEKEWPEANIANTSIANGNPNVYLDQAEFFVHPPVGKWLIAAGEHMFGMNSFGWRFPSLVFGALMMLVLIRMVRRVSRSTLIGALAGVLLMFDGLHFVMSRIGLLDMFLAFFLMAAVGCLVADRDWFRTRLARHLAARGLPDLRGAFGPKLWFRPWRIGAGVLFGLACGTKWNGLYVLAAFAVLSLAWDIGARRLAGAGWRSFWGVLSDGIPAFISTVVVGLVVYVSTWAGWLSTTGGYGRDWADHHPDALSVKILGGPLASLWNFHKDIYGFHSGEFIKNATHPYDAHPMGWLVMARPIGIDAVNNIPAGTQGCPVGPDQCLQVISGSGTPLLWWMGLIALLFAAFFWLASRDWRFGIPIVGLLSNWLPWFAVADRPQFFFYAITIIPFTVMALALCLGKLLGPATSGERRRLGAIIVAAAVGLIGFNFAFMYPVLTDKVITYPQWLMRMWFRSWI